MKVRNGFVSNSSSSSFIIALPNIKNLTKEKILEDIKIDTHYFDEDDYYEKDCFKKEIDKIETAINKGYNVIRVEIEYGESEDVLRTILDNVNGEILIEGD